MPPLAMTDQLPRFPQRRTPPPPPINLGDCKSRPAPTTSPVTSAGASSSIRSNTSSSFVFTSSRLQHHRPHVSRPSTPTGSSPSSPARTDTSGSSDTVAGPVAKQRPRPSLTQSQLQRHSEGAIDARSILGPNMRAAGFVHLGNALANTHHHYTPSSHPSPPSTPGTSHPTPSDPPPFPPIVFISPGVATAHSMWGYQQDKAWCVGTTGLVRTESDGLAQESVVDTTVEESSSSELDYGARFRFTRSFSNLVGSHHSPPSVTTSRSYSSTSTLVSSPSSSSSNLPSQSSTDLLAPSPVFTRPTEKRLKGKEVAKDEYPFPDTAPVSPSPLTHERAQTTPFRPLRRKEKDRTPDRSYDKPVPERASAGQVNPLSITELCGYSHFGWTTHPESLVPQPPSHLSNGSLSSSSAPSVKSAGSTKDRTPGSSHSPGKEKPGSSDSSHKSPKGHQTRDTLDRALGTGQADAERQRKKEHLTALVHAYRERDREHARHVAADLKKQRRDSCGYAYPPLSQKQAVTELSISNDSLSDAVSALHKPLSELTVYPE